jgi:hypothetical protein
MTKDDIIRMAREAQGTPYVNRHYPGLTSFGFNETTLAVFAKLVAAAEREACAEVAEEYATGESRDYSENIAEEIRARGENT